MTKIPQPTARTETPGWHAPSAHTRGGHPDPASGQRHSGGLSMKLLPLIWKSVWRRKIRTIFTLLCVFIAFLLFGILMTVRMAFTFGVEIAGLDRLVII